MKNTNKNLNVNCPHCKKEFNYYSSNFRPFCTEKCKMIDLGHWFDESYSVAGRDNTVYIENPEQLKALMEQDEN